MPLAGLKGRKAEPQVRIHQDYQWSSDKGDLKCPSRHAILSTSLEWKIAEVEDLVERIQNSRRGPGGVDDIPAKQA